MADSVEVRRSVPERTGSGWGLPVALILFVLVLLLALSRTQPPEPKGADAPAAEFSAGRAREVLRTLLGDGRPHPVGSPANAAVRDRVIAELRRLGYAPEVRPGVSCAPFGCAKVENIVARLEGREPANSSVLLMSHYDSVGAGPGASDDMTGVAAVLEVARALKAGPAPRNPVLLLIDDGEEAGLLGADLFASEDMAKGVGVVVNLEARGTSGPSLMFETSGPDASLVRHYAGAASHPVASSVFATIYNYLPNDTDLSVFKRKRVPGLNFAFIGNPSQYHTPLDNFENASPASLQHHGDNALASVRSLAEADLTALQPGNAVFFDLLGTSVIWWPAGWSILLAALALLLVIAAAVLGARRMPPPRSMGFGLLAFLLALVVSGLLAFGLARGLFAGLLTVNWVASPAPLVAVFWLAPLAVVLGMAGAFSGRTGAVGAWAGVWLWWALLGVVTAVLAPGLSYLFLVPALVAGLVGLVGARGAGGFFVSVLPGLAAAVLWFPLISFLYEGLGGGGLLPIAILVTLAASTLAPLAAGSGPAVRRWLPLAAGAAALVLAFVAISGAHYSPASPQPVMIQYHQDGDSGKARWLVRGAPPVPAPMLAAAAFGKQPEAPFPWSPPYSRAFAAPAPALPGVQAPTLTVLEDTAWNGKRKVRLQIASPRGAQVALLFIPEAAKVDSVKMAGKALPARQPGPGWASFVYLTLPPEGVEVEAVLGETKKLDWYVIDQSSGLPPGGEALQKSRPATATAYQDGDVSLVSRKVGV